MFQAKVVEKMKTHILCSVFFFNPAFYDIMCKNMAEPDRPQMIIWCMLIACCITKATDTHSECYNTDFSYNNICMNISQPQITLWRMRIACCITKATDTHSECIILISPTTIVA